MGDLNKYKKVWQNQNIDNQLDSKSLNQMIHRRSSSVVKWIFYISLIEFVAIILLNIFVKTDWEQYKAYGLYNFMIGVSIYGYILTFLFIILFYINYKSITVTESTKGLIERILNTRKTVKYYILINLVSIALVLFYSFYIILQSSEFDTINEQLGYKTVWIIVTFAILFVIGILYIFYSLLYGILINKLNKNYKELTEEL